MTELIPIMKRENPKTPPTPENVMQFFIDRVRHGEKNRFSYVAWHLETRCNCTNIWCTCRYR